MLVQQNERRSWPVARFGQPTDHAGWRRICAVGTPGRGADHSVRWSDAASDHSCPRTPPPGDSRLGNHFAGPAL